MLKCLNENLTKVNIICLKLMVYVIYSYLPLYFCIPLVHGLVFQILKEMDQFRNVPY